MTKEFSNKTVFISGAGTGIGASTAILFAQEGADLVLVGRRKENLEATAQTAKEFGTKISIHSLDVNDTASMKNLITSLPRLDIAVNNAGIEGSVGDITTLTSDDYDVLMNTNVKSLWLSMQEQIRWMRDHQKPGYIINISSVAGIRAFAESSLYVGSKHAVIGMSQAAAIEQIRHGIRINVVSPGAVDTPMLSRIFSKNMDALSKAQPIKRLAQPKEIAEAILWLSSEKSSFVVGHNLVVDGGKTI
jgi:NAD(P)-dependent dehydrogenase (short-subunit alcohol dehydrogenase family)